MTTLKQPTDSIASLLAQISAKNLWNTKPQSGDEAELTRIVEKIGRPLPANLKSLMLNGYLADVGCFTGFGLIEFWDVNSSDYWSPPEPFPEAWYFGSDGGYGFFLLDTIGCINGHPGEVFMCDRGCMDRETCVPCGESLEDFLGSLLAGEKRCDGPTLWEIEREKPE